jgi:GTP-binding protein Era
MLRDREAPVPDGPPRSGTVAIVGRSNVGKSTLLNAALEMPLAIVSPTPQTTRDALLGVVRHGTAEVALLDTPGIFEAETALDRAMNRAADDAIEGADVVVFVTAVSKTATQNDDALRPNKRDLELLRALPASAKVVLAVNKIDLVRDKRRMLPMLSALGEARTIEAVVPISALREDGVRRVLDEVAKLLPEGEPRYGEDDVTDRPARFFAREYVREQILLATHEEVPHSVAVTIDAWTDGVGSRATRVAATIHVERSGQKKILVGTGGSMLTRIGSSARARLAELVGGPVHLELFVRVTENWRNAPTKLGDMGYGPRAGEEGGGGSFIATIDAGANEDTDEKDDEDDPDADLGEDEDES